MDSFQGRVTAKQIFVELSDEILCLFTPRSLERNCRYPRFSHR
jgi:hypothetical protein